MVNPGCDPGVTSKGPSGCVPETIAGQHSGEKPRQPIFWEMGSLYSDLDYLDYLVDPFWFSYPNARRMHH